MAQKRTALITGITGQDGSYLAEFLLEKGYRVFGMVRRSSTETFERITHLMGRVELVEGDLLDQLSLINLMKKIRPVEVYNLASQSFVPTSFEQPVLTGEFTALGVTRMLEAVKLVDRRIRFYQASSSEMFGLVEKTPQDEKTAFHPRSPYGVAKVYGHWITVNYRESYRIFAVSGILFNHECVTSETPVIIRQNGLVDCVPISEVIVDPVHVPQRELNLEIWDLDGWTKARLGTVTWNEGGRKEDKRVHRILDRSGEVRATADHLLILKNGKGIPAEGIRENDKLLTTLLPNPPEITHVSSELAEFLGLMTADGYAGYREGKYSASFRNNNSRVLEKVVQLWKRLFGGSATPGPGRSGFTGAATDGIRLQGSQAVRHWLYEMLYTREGAKRVPQLILNADANAWRAFLSGYNCGDGLKKGHGKREFKNFKTSSPVLAAGLWWMASRVLDQKLVLNVDRVERQGIPYYYYSINLGSEGGSNKGKHLLRSADEVKRVREENYTGWLYDVETESGTFHAGIGNLVIHNSPRRGREFVTRRISDGVARIKLGFAKKLALGNLEAKRDWGFAGDYVRAMWLMLQQDKPRDFVVATGSTHSVREFAELAFRHAGLRWKQYVVVDKTLFRPAEVHALCGDAAKARLLLGWKPECDFEALVRMMVDADLERLRFEGRGAV